MKYMELLDVHGDYVTMLIKKLSPPLVTLLSAEPEIQYVALRNINLIVQKRYVRRKLNEICYFNRHNFASLQFLVHHFCCIILPCWVVCLLSSFYLTVFTLFICLLIIFFPHFFHHLLISSMWISFRGAL